MSDQLQFDESDGERLAKLWTPGKDKVWEVLRIKIDRKHSVRLRGKEVYVLPDTIIQREGLVIEEMLNKIAPLGPREGPEDKKAFVEAKRLVRRKNL
jgi:hypothetical protein